MHIFHSYTHKIGPRSKTRPQERASSPAEETPRSVRPPKRTPLPRSQIEYDPNGDPDEDGRNLDDKEYLYRLVTAEKELLRDVVKGEPFFVSSQRNDQHVRPSWKIYNDSRRDPYNKHTEIRVHTVVQRGLRYRSINKVGQNLVSATLNEARVFTEHDRAMYKMVIIQMLDNLNFISARYAHKRIKLQNPTKELKQKILNYYH